MTGSAARTLGMVAVLAALAAPAEGRAPTVGEAREAHWLRARLTADREAEKHQVRPEEEVAAANYGSGAVPFADWKPIAEHVRNKDLRPTTRLRCAQALRERVELEAAKTPDQRQVNNVRKAIARDLIELWRKDDQQGWLCLQYVLNGFYPGVKEETMPGRDSGKRAQAYAAWKKFLND